MGKVRLERRGPVFVLTMTVRGERHRRSTQPPLFY